MVSATLVNTPVIKQPEKLKKSIYEKFQEIEFLFDQTFTLLPRIGCSIWIIKSVYFCYLAICTGEKATKLVKQLFYRPVVVETLILLTCKKLLNKYFNYPKRTKSHLSYCAENCSDKPLNHH